MTEVTAELTLERFVNMQIWGTPESRLEEIRAMQAEAGARNISLQVQWGDLTNGEALASMTLFAHECMDHLHTIPAPMPQWLFVDALGAVPA